MADEAGKPKLIGRRNVLKYGGLLTATAAGQEFLSAWLAKGNTALAATGTPTAEGSDPAANQSSPASASAQYTPRFFQPGEFRTVEILTAMIIPTDDKPGAKEARVAEYIDHVVYAAGESKPEFQQQWTEGLAELGQLSKAKFHRDFLELSEAERVKFLTDVARPEYEGFPVSGPKYKSMRLDPNMSRSEHDATATPPGFAFYKLVKEMTVEAFYSSKIGLMDVLEFKGLSMNPDFPGCTHPEHLA